MANRLMTKSEAKDYCERYGYPEFIDMLIKDKIIVERDPVVTCLMSNDNYNDRFGTIRVEMWPEGLVLWVGGEIRWKSFE